MIISGIQVEKKTTQVIKLSKKHKKQDRPHSSQFPDIYEGRRKSNVLPYFEKKQQTRNHSSNKIPFKSNLKLKKQESQQQNNQRQVTPMIQAKNKKSNVSTNKITSQKMILKTPILDISPEEERKLIAYFRYYPVSFVAACGQKQQFFKSLKEYGDFKVLDKKLKVNKPKQIRDSLLKLLKLAQLKGKYKYREKFNYAYSAQLKALNYKRKQWKKKKEQESSSSEDQGEKRQKCRDLDTWKKAMGVKGSKVFIIKGKYKDLKNALIERGWVENEDKYSNFFDLKWTTKISDINFQTLKPGQMVNHFNNNACLTSKYGLCKSLRSIMYSESLDIDKYFPKAYDLADLGDFQNFLQMYKIVFCQSIIKKFIGNGNGQNFNKYLQEIDKSNNSMLISFVKVALMVIERKYFTPLQTIINNALNGKFSFCSINQWNYLNNSEADLQEIQKSLTKAHLQQLTDTQLYDRVVAVIQHLKQQEPQLQLNGSSNIWIVKPAFLSRGRGIKCFSSLSQILDYSINKQTQYVVQKYIENPLIVQYRKFDIRQWVIIQDYNPPRVWFYGEFYLRFCLDVYNAANLKNKYAHLTNNSIQKTKKIKKQKVMEQKDEQQQRQAGQQSPRKFEKIQQSMWTQQEFKEYLEKNPEFVQKFGPHPIKNIITKMKQIVIASVISTQDQVYARKNTFELIGYDFMLDSNLNPWLIEINSSPSMDYSTPVTRKLVKMVLQDTVAVLTQGQTVINKPKKKRQCGQFKCIYKGEQFKTKNYLINYDEVEEKNQK